MYTYFLFVLFLGHNNITSR